MRDIIALMAEKVEPYRKVTTKEVADRTGGGRGLLRMRHQRMKEKAARNINTFRQRQISGEVKSRSAENLFLKNPEHQMQLALVNELLQDYCNTINVSFKQVPAQAIRTISKKEKYPETFDGQYDLHSGLMYIDEDLRGFRLFWTILHEVLHAIGRTTFIAVNSRGAWATRRVGYESRTERGKEFSGFNEGVVEMIVHKISESKYNEISQRLHEIKLATGVDGEESRYLFQFIPHAYDAHYDLVDDVIKKEAYARQFDERGETDDDTLLMEYLRPVELEMIQGYFSGNMMHFRSIEKHFGEGSLRLIAALQDTDGSGTERGALFLNYFSTLPDEWPTRLHIASEFIQNTESFALFLRTNIEVLQLLEAYIEVPLPEARSKEYEQHIGLACGMYGIFERRLKVHAGPHSRRMHAEYVLRSQKAHELRDAYMRKFALNANDVPVLVSRPERHLTLGPKNSKQTE